jgi:hypothetical protein
MATYIISGVSAAQCATNGFTVISSTSGPTGDFGAIAGSYKAGSYAGVDFVIGIDTDGDPTAAQAAFTATGSVGGIYMAQRVPLGAANSYTVCFPQYASEQGAAQTFNRIMAYNFPSDGTNFTTNDYLSAAIQGYIPQVRTVAQFITEMKNIGIPVFNNSGTLQ